MDYVNLGKTGLKVSRICLGCMTYGRPPAAGEPTAGRHAWALNEEESQPFLRQALDVGINFFDTANVYSSGASEEVVGRFLKGAASRTGVGSRAKRSFMNWMRACDGCRWIMWICIRSIGGMLRRRSRRRWRRCTMW